VWQRTQPQPTVARHGTLNRVHRLDSAHRTIAGSLGAMAGNLCRWSRRIALSQTAQHGRIVCRMQSTLFASVPHRVGVVGLSGLLLRNAVNAPAAREERSSVDQFD
jgi:hypothetical protein